MINIEEFTRINEEFTSEMLLSVLHSPFTCSDNDIDLRQNAFVGELLSLPSELRQVHE
jgi:hypothetical protein